MHKILNYTFFKFKKKKLLLCYVFFFRHINQWKDDSNYLKQTAFLEWLAQTVDKSLALAGTIPNYQVRENLYCSGKICSTTTPVYVNFLLARFNVSR